MTQQLACDAMLMALACRGSPRGVISHSDRGSQYCSEAYQALLKKYGLICSMSRKANCWDNSVAESFFRTLKTELIYTQKFATREEARQSVFHYIETYYNRRRLHSANEFVAPAIYESSAVMLEGRCL